VSSGGSPLTLLRKEAVLDSVLSARAGDGTRLQRRRKSPTARLALPPARSLTARGRREPERRQTCPSFSRVVKVTRGSRRFVVTSLDRAPARPAGVSEEPTFRKGRAHDRFVVAEVGRTASSSWTRAAPVNRGGVPKRNAARGNPRGASERPADGRRSGSSVLAAIVTDRRGRMILAARSQTPPRFPMREGGSPPVGPRARGGQAERGDGSVRGCESVDVAGRERPRRKAGTGSIRSAWGVVKTRHASGGLLARAKTAGSPNENVGARRRSVVGRKLVARISGR
jgi:hypothetical protein